MSKLPTEKNAKKTKTSPTQIHKLSAYSGIGRTRLQTVMIQHKIRAPWKIVKIRRKHNLQNKLIHFIHFQTFPKIPKSLQNP